MSWKPTREMYDRFPATHLAAFRLRDRDGAEHAVVIDGSFFSVGAESVIPTSEALAKDLPIIFDTTEKENPE